MARGRVLSFMSQFSGPKTPPTTSPSPPVDSPPHSQSPKRDLNSLTDHYDVPRSPATPPSLPDYGSPVNASPSGSPTQRHRRNGSRPLSMVSAHQPPLMEINEDTIPELLPIFSFLNSHANKLYQEGYFLKLDDQDTQGRPNQDRTWTECFAQLVGTVLSLWDAAELDAAGEDGEVLPKFINLTDASIKMIDSLPTRSKDEQPLQNILSISTAGRNRYLLHFNSHHSLVQWTAGIRLAIFEHTILQEAYTGALIAGKGKTLNNINVIMERSRFKSEDWVRVRFGAGVPWRRCWCVITPPDEKEYMKQQKEMKKRSPYDRSAAPVLKGTINFYDTRKEGKKGKKMLPIASITDAYSAHAIYPQAKSLVDASTLIKVEGDITVHADPPSSTEGFVFIMPETHPAVSGFEMMLRFLFPTWDTFGLYGRPGKLIASTLDPRSIMFAMPKHKRYGYLETIDVASLLVDDNSSSWSEREWRRRLKEVTGVRMNAMDEAGSSTHSRSNSGQNARLSYGAAAGVPGKPKVGFADDKAANRTSRSFSLNGGQRPGASTQHVRNSSETDVSNAGPYGRSNLGGNSPYQGSPGSQPSPQGSFQDKMGSNGSYSPDSDPGMNPPSGRDFDGVRRMQTPEPVSQPPVFNSKPQGRPTSKAYHSPELRRANSRLSSSTLAQLVKNVGFGDKNSPSKHGRGEGVMIGPSVQTQAAASVGTSANSNRSREALSPPGPNQQRGGLPPPVDTSGRSRSPMDRSANGPPSPYTHAPKSPRPPGPGGPPGAGPDGRQSPYPPGGPGGPGGPGSRGPTPQGFRPDPNRPPTAGRGQPPPNGPYGAQRPGPGQRPYPGPPGPVGPGGPGGPGGYPQRKPLPPGTNGPAAQGPSATDDILDSYAGGDPRQRDPYARGPPGAGAGAGRPQPPGQQNLAAPNMSYDNRSPSRNKEYASSAKSSDTSASYDRPRAGVLKSSGVADEPQQARSQFDIPDVNFGPTVNYGASSPPRKPVGGAGPGQAPRPYSPAGARPTPPPHQAPGYRQPDTRTAAWHPAAGPPGPGAQPHFSPEQYVQQRAAASAAQYSHGRTPSGNLIGGTDVKTKRRSSFDMLDPGRPQGDYPGAQNRPSSSNEMYDSRQQMGYSGNQYQPQPPPHGAPYQQQERSMSPAMGRGGGEFGQPAGSFSRPMRPGAPADPRMMPPQGQYGQGAPPQSPRGVPPPYHGQAF